MRKVGRFLLGSVVGFGCMALALVALHAQPAPVPHGVAIPTKPPAKQMVVKPMTYKCVAMGAAKCQGH